MAGYLEEMRLQRRRKAEVKAKIEQAGRLPEGMFIGLAWYDLLGKNAKGAGLYGYRSRTTGVWFFWIVSRDGDLMDSPAVRPAGFEKRRS